jgi:hypothetical protein
LRAREYGRERPDCGAESEEQRAVFRENERAESKTERFVERSLYLRDYEEDTQRAISRLIKYSVCSLG